MISEILVTGATGNVGKELVNVFSQNNTPVKAIVRSRDPAKQMTLPNVQYVEGDLTNPTSLQEIFAGCKKLFLLLPLAQNMVDLGISVVNAALHAGIPHIVKLSVLLPEDSDIKIYQMHKAVEDYIVANGFDYTFLKANTFFQNYINYCGPTIRNGDSFYLPLAGARISLIDIRDIASVAFKVLTSDVAIGQNLELTGPESLSNEDVAGVLTHILDRHISYAPISDQVATSSMIQSGISFWLITALIELYRYQRSGEASFVSEVVQDITGDSPIRFERFVTDYKSAFMGAHASEVHE
jgi:uncharacterized protein YbjT (DUF2867 family)